MTIDALISQWQRIEVPQVLALSIEATARDIVLYQKQQLLHGETSSGGKIGKYRNPAYALMKYQMNPLAGMGFIDLTLTKDFANGIFIDVRSRSVVIVSADEKFHDLQEMYGSGILGLNKHFAADYANTYLAPAFVQHIKKLLK